MADLFDNTSSQKSAENAPYTPLADAIRPKTFDDLYGQDHLTHYNASFSKIIASGKIPSLILWGPPGCGKTTLARIIAENAGTHYEQISAIFSGVGDLRKLFDRARKHKKCGQRTVLFVDEIHRFSKSQQDAFLPVVEDGTIILIGATTENPSFELNSALLSRAQVYVLKRLDDKALEQILERAEQQLETRLPLTDDARQTLKAIADGDGRYLLNMIEHISATDKSRDTELISSQDLMQIVQTRRPIYDKNDEGHYNLISALHKSVRGSDPDASLYWFNRILLGGEDPNFLGRRLVRMAVEDIGLADPNALSHAIDAWQAYERLGSPEGELALANAVIYLATAPKSNAAYKAYKTSLKSARENGSLMPPKHILNAPTKLMKNQGYSEGYIYDHDTKEGFSGQSYFPENMKRPSFYAPYNRGYERELNKRMEYWDKLRKEKTK